MIAQSSFCNYLLDAVIPVHEKDVPNLDIIIESLRENVEGLRNVYVVSKEKYTDAGLWVPEAEFLFSIEDVAAEVGGQGGIGDHYYRGWFYQQLLKFYAPFVIKGCLDHVLIFDADTRPNHKISFFDEDKTILSVVKNLKNFDTYNDHMLELFPELKSFDSSFNPVNHHIVFSKDILEDMFARIKTRFDKPFWKVFLNQVTMKYGLHKRAFLISASEYTIYTHYCLHYFPERVRLRDIKIVNRAPNLMKEYPKSIDFVTSHFQYVKEARKKPSPTS